MSNSERKAGWTCKCTAAALMFAGLILGGKNAAHAQYSVKEWANFEDGVLPANAVTIGGHTDQTLKVISVDSITTEPAAFHPTEVGKKILQLTSVPNAIDATTFMTGLAVGGVLDRKTLGPKGRALFQADFYVEADGKFPSLAVLAMSAPEPGEKNIPTLHKAFYRFGMTLGSRLFFSCVIPGAATAPIFLQDPNLIKSMPRPGWHRFAIACEGPDTLRCYLDGREAEFSPIKEASISKIMVGLILADQKESYQAYADNLSIQVSADAPSLPASPYESGWSKMAGPSAKAKQSGVNLDAPMAATTNLASDWLEPLAAWDKAKTTKQPMLLYFYAPGVERINKMNDILNNDPKAKAYISSHACARVDVNQLEGGSIAKKYNIFKVPALLVISSDATQAKRVTPGPNDNWDAIAAQLKPL